MQNHTGSISRWQFAALAMLLAATVLGCGRAGPYPAEGIARFADDGAPLSGGTIETEPVFSGGEEFIARGTIQPDGTFRLGTHTEDDGAMGGLHRVRVLPPESPIPGSRPIHPLMQSFDTSGWEFYIHPDPEKNKLVVDVQFDRKRR